LNQKDLALSIAQLALDKQAHDLEIIDVTQLVDYADYVVVCGGRAERQVRAVAEAIRGGLKKLKISPLGVEGLSQGQWVLMDYGSVVVHVFLEHVRAYYDIEGLWLDAKRLEIDEPTAEPATEDQRGRCASGS
jgi:ribosome-associated protein